MSEYTITTTRLKLRLLQKTDVNVLLELEMDPEVKKYFPDGPRDHSKTTAMVEKFISYYENEGLPNFIIFDLVSDEFIGRAGFGITEHNEIEIGYVLHKKFWGRGIAAEAVSALLAYAKKYIAKDYIIAYADINNLGSTRVMEKCGMTYYKTDMAKGILCKFYRIKNT